MVIYEKINVHNKFFILSFSVAVFLYGCHLFALYNKSGSATPDEMNTMAINNYGKISYISPEKYNNVIIFENISIALFVFAIAVELCNKYFRKNHRIKPSAS